MFPLSMMNKIVNLGVWLLRNNVDFCFIPFSKLNPRAVFDVKTKDLSDSIKSELISFLRFNSYYFEKNDKVE